MMKKRDIASRHPRDMCHPCDVCRRTFVRACTASSLRTGSSSSALPARLSRPLPPPPLLSRAWSVALLVGLMREHTRTHTHVHNTTTPLDGFPYELWPMFAQGSIELIKLVLGVPLAMYSNVFLNLALPLLVHVSVVYLSVPSVYILQISKFQPLLI